jgi:hypothetical protein
VAKLIAAYTEDLVFSQDDEGNFNLSPYDVFLKKNDLPQHPQPKESDREYSRRLLDLLEQKEKAGTLQFVTDPQDGAFQFHQQPFVFGETEVKGLKIFLREPARGKKGHVLIPEGGIGNCIACHAAPNFTDFGFHNTGTTQVEYDDIHYEGAFAKLRIPRFLKRLLNFNAYLPATERHPDAKEPFRAIPSKDDPQKVDLGLWNIFANPDFPKSQKRIGRILCEQERNNRTHFYGPRFASCRPAHLLQKAIASFKTPGLRDLGHSAPYMHNGQFDTLTAVIGFYVQVSGFARQRDLRNGDPDLKEILLINEDINPLVAFLQALNEDYE